MENFIEQIEKNKIAIIRKWISFPAVIELIKKYELDENLFIRRYSFAVVEHFILVIKKDEKTEKNSAVIDFLKYLKKQNFKINELFLIFSAFRDSLIDFIFKMNIETIDLIEKINFNFEKIFSVILDIYSRSISEIESALNKSIDIVDKYVIMSRTDLNGIIISVSNAFCKVSGYESFELIGKPFDFLKHSDMKDEFFLNIKEIIQSGEMWQGEIKNQKKNGEFYWLKTTIHPNFDNNGKVISYDAINEDITSQKELKNQQNLLVEQSKSAAMGEMISMIAHQWRQPLQAVSILIQKLPLLKEIQGEISDEMLNDVVSQVSVQLDYMSKTIDDFRDYFKPNKKKEEVYIENVINKSMDFLSYLFKINSVEIRYKNESTSKIELFLNEMVQVFINLAKNSCDAMIEREIKDRFINIYSYEKNKKLYVEFEDNAGGISKNFLNKIFEPYFSTKSNKNGTGLGLYMIKTIIEQYSFGKIDVYNTEVGTKFIIELPLK